MLLSLLLNVAQAGSCTTFEFVGQPECVQLDYQRSGTVRLTNSCPDPVLLDQSVLPRAEGSGVAAAIGSNQSKEIVGLTFFTLGMGGTLYKVIAVVSSETCAEKSDLAIQD